MDEGSSVYSRSAEKFFDTVTNFTYSREELYGNICTLRKAGAGLRYQTHIITSVAAGAYLTTVTDAPFTFTFVGGIIVGSLIPDIDEPNSYIGRRSFGIAKLIKKAFGHRGLTHSLLAWMCFSLIYYFYPNHFTYGLCAGYLFHIAGDFFSKRGVPLFSPIWKKKFKFLITYETGKIGEKLIMLAAIFAIGYLVYTNQLYTQLFVQAP